MRRIFIGAALLVAGIAAFIEAHSHRPHGLLEREVGAPSSLSRGDYDLLRIGAWALVIIGVLLIVTCLVAYWASVTRSS